MINADPVWDPAFVDPTVDSRATSFENPTGGRGAGGTAHGGRKGAPNRTVAPGERVVLADLEGPGVVRHVWMTWIPAPPAVMRGLVVEVFYDGAEEPSVSVPALDFFALPHGRPVAYHSALMSAQEGRGFNCYLPMPFRRRIRVELANQSGQPAVLYYQVDYTLQPDLPPERGWLHATFRRENPTTMGRDFVIVDGLEGPGRFIGCNVGVRVLDTGAWYGEGEVKIYRDGDDELPTICGTGLEDYVGTAWGMGSHAAPYGGAPLVVPDPRAPSFVGFYRWHLADPVMFERHLRVTIQQIGAAIFRLPDEQEAFDAYSAAHPSAGDGWWRNPVPLPTWGIVERVDDYCATAYVYCREPQPVPRVDIDAALADLDLTEGETPIASPLDLA